LGWVAKRNLTLVPSSLRSEDCQCLGKATPSKNGPNRASQDPSRCCLSSFATNRKANDKRIKWNRKRSNHDFKFTFWFQI